MAIAAPVIPLESIPGIPEQPDDLPDPVVPAAALAVPPDDPAQRLRDDVHAMLRVWDASIDKMPELLDKHYATLSTLLSQALTTLSASEAGALQHLVETLATIQAQGVQVSGSPYAATIHAKTPTGFAVSLTIQRTDGAAFLDALSNMATWLHQAGYTPLP